MKKVLALGILYGFFCGSTDTLAGGLSNVKDYGKWADETGGADASVVDEGQEPAVAGNDVASNDPTVPENTNTPETTTESNGPMDQNQSKEPEALTPDNALDTNVMDEAPVQDGYVPIAAGATPTSNAADHKNWWKHPQLEFGILAGGSGSYIPVNEKLVSTTGFGSPEHYKFHVSGEGLSTGINLYAGYRRGNNTFGAGVTGYVDTHTLKNYDAKRDLNSARTVSSMTFLNRSYTLEFAARAGHYFEDLHLYGKLGILCSAFQYKLRNHDTDSKESLTAWGGSAGVGLQKPFSLPALGESKIGLEYNYQIYQTVTPVIRYTGHVDTSKLRPRYHTGFLTISKPL